MSAIPSNAAAPAPDPAPTGTADGPPARPWQPLPPGLSAFWIVTTLLAVAFINFARRPDFVVHPQFWAEDNAILFPQAREAGWHSLFIPYPTYYILGQRLVAWMATPFPLLWAPSIYCYAAWGYSVLAAWFCLRARLDYLMDYRGRIALALALVLSPQCGETMMVLIGSQWSLVPILCLLILQAGPVKPLSAAMDLFGLVLAGLSGPFIVLFSPWFLLRFRRVTGGFSPYNCLFVAVAWGIAALQIYSNHQIPAPMPPWCRDPASWVKAVGFRLPGGLFFGAWLPHYLGPLFWVLSPALLALLGWALWRAERKRLWPLLALLGCAAGIYAGGLSRAGEGLAVDLDPFGVGGRYFYPVYLLVMWMGIVCVFDASARLRLAASVALAMILVSTASMFVFQAQPDLHWSKYARKADAGEAQPLVPVLPAGWFIELPARR